MKHARVFTVFYCTSIVMMLILLHGCAGTTHTPATQSVPTVTTETHTKVEQLVENPETGVYEMKVVREERTKTTVTTEAHTTSGHSAGKTDWGFYALNVLIIAVNLYLLMSD